MKTGRQQRPDRVRQGFSAVNLQVRKLLVIKGQIVELIPPPGADRQMTRGARRHPQRRQQANVV